MVSPTHLLQMYPQIIPFRFPNLPQVAVYFTTGLYGSISLDSGPQIYPDSTRVERATGGSGSHESGHNIQKTGEERRAALAPLLGFKGWTELRQVHGLTVLAEPPATPFESPSVLEADGSCSSRPGQALLSKAADCQQILLAHKSGKYVAALHCGWRGNRADFPRIGVESFCAAYQLEPSDIMAVRGPSLGPGAAEFVNFEREWGKEFRPWFNEQTRCMDLWSLTRRQLAQAGLPAENIFGIDLCTSDFSNFLFSYRRGHSGRQGALIFIES